MKDRIQLLLQQERLTITRLADILDINKSNISHILSGRNNPSLDILQKILRKFPKINPKWLLLGEQQMYLSNNNIFENKTNLEVFENKENNNTIKSSDNDFITNKLTNDDIKKIVIFYEDGSFEYYIPRK